MLPLILTLVASACTTPDGVSFEDCPITAPLGGVPDEVRFARPAPWVQEDTGWYGNSELWVSLPPNGVLPSRPSSESPELLDTKFPWWRIIPGHTEVHTLQVGSNEVIEGIVLDGYGQIGFHPSALLFSNQGCWQVTGVVADEELTFVIWVCETESFPAEVSAEERQACGAV